MSRDELFDKLHALAQEAQASPELLPIAGILFTLCGAMASRDELALFDHCIPFAAAQVERMSGEPDWSDDTLKV